MSSYSSLSYQSEVERKSLCDVFKTLHLSVFRDTAKVSKHYGGTRGTWIASGYFDSSVCIAKLKFILAQTSGSEAETYLDADEGFLIHRYNKKEGLQLSEAGHFRFFNFDDISRLKERLKDLNYIFSVIEYCKQYSYDSDCDSD